MVERGPEKAGVGGSIPSLATSIPGRKEQSAKSKGSIIVRCSYPLALCSLPPYLGSETLESVFQEMKRNVVGVAAGAS